MILVCPSCDAKFNIPAGAISGEGRKVRCARCKNSWHATNTDLRTPAPAAPKVAQVAQPSVAAPAPVAAAAPKPPVNFDGNMDADTAAETAALRQSVRADISAAPSPAPEPEDDFYEESVEKASSSDINDDDFSSEPIADFGASLREKYGDGIPDDSDFDDDFGDDDDDDFVTRRRAEQRKQNDRVLIARERKLVVVGSVTLLLFILASIYFVFIDRTYLRQYLPTAAAFFDDTSEGLTEVEQFRKAAGDNLTPSNAEAVEIVRALLHENGGAGVETRDGQQVLVLRGYVENMGRTGANVPKVRASIINSSGQVIDSWVFDPPGLLIRRGGRLQFEQIRSPIPVGISQVKVEVIKDSRSSTEGEFPE